MPTTDNPAGESFRGMILRLRGRTGLTQRELATLVGVNVSSIQGWEAGANYPGVASLKALIAAGLQAGAFTAGRESAETQELWAAARRDAPRFQTPFDGAWFEGLAVARGLAAQDNSEGGVAAPLAPSTLSGRARSESWGEAPDVAGFLGRAAERALLGQWVLDEGSRVVAVLGLGGIGKTLLATRLAHDLAPSFEKVFWRSLRDAPTPGEWLAEAIGFLAPSDPRPAEAESARVRRLLELLRAARCLLVLDNVETVLQPRGRAGAYRSGYEGYGTLLRQVAEAPHRSCLVITSREEPVDLAPLQGKRGPVRIVVLAGLPVEDGRALLSDKRLDGDDAAWQALVARYGGNGLALKVVGETTREVFGGSIAEFLAYVTATPGVLVGGVRQLLRAQIQRLVEPEQELLRRLAVEREPVGIAELAAELGPDIGRAATLEAVEGLLRRSLLERTDRGPRFGLHSLVLEYATDQLVDDVGHELASGELDRLVRQPLLKATAKDFVRRSQERLIGAPLVERLVERQGSPRAAEQLLVRLLDQQRRRPVEAQGYGPGNLVNLLRLLRGDLKGVDLSGLSIRQAYLQEVEAQGASLAGAHLAESVLGEAFSYPTSLALSADGAFLAAGTASGEVCRWRVTDRTLLMTLPGHTSAICGVALSGDGGLVASSALDGTVRLWDAASGSQLADLQGHTGGVRGVALSGDGRLVASGGVDGTVRLWDAESGRPLADLKGHGGEVYSVALSRDGRLLASGGFDGTVRLWDAVGGLPLATLRGHTGGVWGVALDRDGRLVASGGLDGMVRLWDAESGRPLATLQGHASLVYSVALSGDGRLAASSDVDGTVRLWDAANGRQLAVLHGHTSGVRGVALSGDGRLVASGGFDGTVRLWDAVGGLPLATLHGQTGGVWGVASDRDGRLVASGSVGTVRLWDAASGRPLSILHGHTGGVRGVALSGDGRLVASGSLDGTVRLWDAESGRQLAILHGHTGGVRGVALSGDGRLVASGGFDGTVRLWDAESGCPLATLQGHAGEVYSVALSRDGRLLASGGVDGMVNLWDVGDELPLVTLDGHTGGVLGVALSGDGCLVASGGFDGMVRLWDAEREKPLPTLQGHASLVYSVALSGDGRLLASGGVDGTVRLSDGVDERSLVTLYGHTGGVLGVALSGDGSLVASGGDDGTVRLWDASSGAFRRVLRAERRYEALDITDLSGITEAQRGSLFTLGAIERRDHPTTDFTD